VASAYLHAIAASSEVDNARALESEDQLLLRNVHAAHEAGTAANLDELRARSSFRRSSKRLSQPKTPSKELILLKREIGIDPGQKIALTDPAPYSDWPPKPGRGPSYRLQEPPGPIRTCKIKRSSSRPSARLTAANGYPPSAVGGYYGVSQVGGAGSHGNFIAQAHSASRSFARPNCAAMWKRLRPRWTPSTPNLTTCGAHIDLQSARLCST